MSGPGKDSFAPEVSPVDVNQFGFGGVLHEDMTRDAEVVAVKLPPQVTRELPTRASRNHDVAMQLLKALKDAKQHLDWIGWGDSYERSCLNGLEKEVDEAIEAGEKL